MQQNNFGMYENRMNGVIREDPLDKTLLVTFSYKAIKNESKSTAEGRAVFDNVEWIKIQIPGSKDSTERKVTENDKRRFHARYSEWKTSGDVPVDGIPLREWPMVSASQVAEFAALNIMTVEQLSAVSDSHLANLGMGGRTLRDRSISYLAQAKESGFAMRVAQENKTLKSELERTQELLAQLSAKVAVLSGQPVQTSALVSYASPVADEVALNSEPVKRGKSKGVKNEK